MNLFLHGCRKFSFLLNEAEDRVLQADEHSFLDRHSEECAKCAALATTAMGLNMLRLCAIEPAVDSGFDDRVMRRLQLGMAKSSVRYWTPAVLGGAIAGIAILAAIQMISRPQQLPVFRGNSEARNLSNSGPMFPELKLDSRGE